MFSFHADCRKQKDSYSIILPTYNEKDHLPIIVWILVQYLSDLQLDYEIINVDDGSTDGTLKVAEKLQEIYGEERITLKPRHKKLGLGTAYIHGMVHAKGNCIILIDAISISHRPKGIPDMTEIKNEKQLDDFFVPGWL